MRSNHSTGLGVAACVALGLTIANPVSGYQQQMQSAADRIGQSMAKAGKSSLAVVDFTDLQGNATELGRFLAEQLSVALGGAGGTYEVIDRNHLRAILQEQKLSATGLIDPLTARKVGKLAGAECLVSGSITPFSESVNLSIKLLDTNSAKILGAVTVEIARTSTIDELLKSGIGSQLVTSNATAKGSGTPASPPAPTAAPITDTAYGVEVSLAECKRGQQTCQGTLTNQTTDPLRVSFANYGINAEVIDDRGNQTAARLVFASNESSVTLEPDLPVKFWLHNVEAADDATKVTVRFTVYVEQGDSGPRVGGFGGTRGGEGRKTIVLRGVPLR